MKKKPKPPLPTPANVTPAGQRTRRAAARFCRHLPLLKRRTGRPEFVLPNYCPNGYISLLFPRPNRLTLESRK